MSGKAEKKLKKTVLRDVYENNLRLQAGDMQVQPEPVTGNKQNKQRTIMVSKTVGSGAYIAMISIFFVLLTFSVYLIGPADPHYTDLAASGMLQESQIPLAPQTNFVALRDEENTVPTSLEKSDLLTAGTFYRNAMPDIADLFGLQVKTIVIDPGHGGKDYGATGDSGLREKDIALDIGLRLRDKLVKLRAARILLTREQDISLSLKDRVRFANNNRADLFISIHVNRLPIKSRPFVESYFFGPHDGMDTQLVSRENRFSGYTNGEFKRMLVRIHDTFKNQESKTLAAAIQNALYGNLKVQNKHLIKGRLKTAPFTVLMNTNMPSVLIETSCLCDDSEEKRLATDTYRDLIASSVGQGIIEYLQFADVGSLQTAYH